VLPFRVNVGQAGSGPDPTPTLGFANVQRQRFLRSTVVSTMDGEDAVDRFYAAFDGGDLDAGVRPAHPDWA